MYIYKINNEDYFLIPENWNYFIWGIPYIIEQTLIEYNLCPQCGAQAGRDDRFYFIPYNYDKVNKRVYCMRCNETLKTINMKKNETATIKEGIDVPKLLTEYQDVRKTLKTVLTHLLQTDEGNVIINKILNHSEIEHKIKDKIDTEIYEITFY